MYIVGGIDERVRFVVLGKAVHVRDNVGRHRHHRKVVCRNDGLVVNGEEGAGTSAIRYLCDSNSHDGAGHHRIGAFPVCDVVDGTETEVAVPACVSGYVVDELIRTEIVGACGRWEHVKALRQERNQCLED